MIHRFLTAFVIPIAVVATAGAQSINVDADIGTLPTSAFGGAANQPGYWNRVTLGDRGFLPEFTMTNKDRLIRDLFGRPTVIGYRRMASSMGSNHPSFTGTSGDFAALLTDAYGVWDGWFKFSGLEPGLYTVYTYAASPTGAATPTAVEVVGSTSPYTQIVTGPVQGNFLQHLRTHSIHQVVTQGTITIRVFAVDANQGSVNGFQLVKH